MIRRQTLLFQLVDDDTVHQVEAINPDYLVIEQAMPRIGLSSSAKAAPMTYMTCLAWAAAKRLGVYGGELVDFKSRDCVALDVVKEDDDDDDEAGLVDPTTRAVGIDSPLHSPASTATPPSGSPATTTD